MPAIPKSKTYETVWLAKWDHKHGEDISIHTTEDGARKQLVTWARGVLEDWQDDSYKNVSDKDLLDNWPEITGETEFLFVEDHILYGPEVWDEMQGKSIKEIDVFEAPK
mgnify:CR=1 FL=1